MRCHNAFAPCSRGAAAIAAVCVALMSGVAAPVNATETEVLAPTDAVGSAPAAEAPAPPARRGLGIPTAPVKAPPMPLAAQSLPYHGMKSNPRARDYYRATWGIDKLKVSYTLSGQLIRFNFRVVEPKLAKALGDHEFTPTLFSPHSGAVLSVPTMEQVGQLRQLHTDKVNEEYWMVFSNKGNLVRRGDRVNVIIGKFHADGLVVE